MPKRKTIFILVLIIIFILVIGGTIYFFIKPEAKKPSPQIPPKEKSLEEKLQDLTAPAGEMPEVSEETLESLTAPKGGEVSEDIIKKLTAPQ